MTVVAAPEPLAPSGPVQQPTVHGPTLGAKTASVGLGAWLRSARTHVPLRDLARLAFYAPEGAARYALQRLRGEHAQGDLSARDADFLALVAQPLRWVARGYFRWRVEGIGHVPATGPALLVGSHNGGLINTDSYLTLLALFDHLGPDRAVHTLVHDWNFAHPVVRTIVARGGGLPAGREIAARALSDGRLVLVYPGSERDTFRSFRDRHRVELGGRRGFVRIALRERVPVVPVVSVGTHEQLIVLTRGDAIARALGLKRWLRADVFPIALSIPWGLNTALLPYVPLPAQTTLAFGEPIEWKGLSREAADDETVVTRCYEDVRRAMQSLLDRLSRGRRPWRG